MMKSIKCAVFALTLSLIVLSSSCASSPADGLPSLANRTLQLAPDLPGFEYWYEVCVKKVLFVCTEKGMRRDTYDLRDEVQRKQFIDMGFVLKVREKHQ